MNKQPIPNPGHQNSNFLNLAALEYERKRQKEETIRWISQSALSKLRHAWGS